jgi:hypothetical protein
VEKSLTRVILASYDPGVQAGPTPASVDEATTMLKTIRVLWLIATAAMIFGFIHFILLGTSTGARIAIEKALAQDLGPDWASWVEYTALTSEGQIYRATLLPVTGKVTEQAPETWPETSQAWWNQPTFPDEGHSICVLHGQVWYSNPEGIPLYALPIAPRAKAGVVFGGLAFLAFVCVVIAALIGKALQKKQAKKAAKRHRSQGLPHRPRR